MWTFSKKFNISGAAGAFAPPGAGSESSAGAKAPPGAGSEFLAGAFAPPGAGSESLAGAFAPPGAGPKKISRGRGQNHNPGPSPRRGLPRTPEFLGRNLILNHLIPSLTHSPEEFGKIV